MGRELWKSHKKYEEEEKVEGKTEEVIVEELAKFEQEWRREIAGKDEEKEKVKEKTKENIVEELAKFEIEQRKREGMRKDLKKNYQTIS